MTRPSMQTFTDTLDKLIYGSFPVVTRSVTIDASQTIVRGEILARKNKKAEIVISGATGGDFILSVDGSDTAAIAHNANAAAVQAALEAIGFLESDIKVTGGALGTNPVIVEFRGRYAGIAVPVTINDAGLTGAGAEAGAVTDLTAGATGRFVAADGSSSGGVEDPLAIAAEDVTTGVGETTAAIVYEAGHFNRRALVGEFPEAMLRTIFRPLGIHLHDSQASDV